MRTLRNILYLFCAMLTLSQVALAQETKAKPIDPVFPYILTIQQPAKGGTLTATIPGADGTDKAIKSGEAVYEGTKVKLTLALEVGYQTKQITHNGTSLTVEPDGNQDLASFTMTGKPTTVIAEAELKTYTIAYALDGGTNYANAPTEYTLETAAITLGTPMKTNFLFDGWYLDTAFATKVASIPTGSTGNLTLYAKWYQPKVIEVMGRPGDILLLPEGTKRLDESLIADTLKTLWPKLTITTDDGQTMEKEITWSFTGTFNDADGKKNPFTWAVTLSDTINTNNYPFSGTTNVINYTKPITPEIGDKVDIPGNATIQGDKEKPIESLNVTPTEDKETIVSIKDLTTGSTTITNADESATTDLVLQGNVDLGDFSTENGMTTLLFNEGATLAANSLNITSGSLVIKSDDNKPIPSLALQTPVLEAGASFTDETGSIEQVSDADGKTLIAITDRPTGGTATPSNPLTLSMGCDISDTHDASYTLQSLGTNRWEDVGASQDEKSFEIKSDTPGTYRIKVEATSTSVLRASTTTTIILHSQPVEVKAGSDPVTPPATTSYTITLPTLTGATTNPAAGSHTVADGGSFSFTLTLDADYDQSNPVVAANGTALTPDANGKYTIANITADISVSITGILKNGPVGVEQVDNETLIRTEGGTLLIRTPAPVTAQVTALTGSVARTVRLAAGDSRIDGLASGIYIVRLSNETTKKVIIR